MDFEKPGLEIVDDERNRSQLVHTSPKSRDGIVSPSLALSQSPSENRLRYHGRRLTSAFLGTELLSAGLRTRIMRRLGFRLHPTVCVWSGCIFQSRNVDMESDVFINIGFYFDGVDNLSVGRNVRFGPFVRIITGTHKIGPPSQRCLKAVISAPVKVEEGCWIGAGVTILPGVTVRHGCVVAAGAVLRDSTEPNGLYAGIPARRIRELDR